jgi:predicted Zn-ribbon and HTH transcriptional regulator
LDRLEEIVDAISAVKNDVNFDAIAHDIKCLKYELKKLLADPPLCRT